MAADNDADDSTLVDGTLVDGNQLETEQRYSLKDAAEIFGDFDQDFEEGVRRSRPGVAPASAVQPVLREDARISRELDRLGEGVSIAQLTEFLVQAKAQERLLDAWDLIQGHLEQADRHDDCVAVLVELKRAGVDDLNVELLPISQSEFTSDELRSYLKSDVAKAREAAELELLARQGPASARPASSIPSLRPPRTPLAATTPLTPSVGSSYAPHSVVIAPPSDGFAWIKPVALVLTLGFAGAAISFAWGERAQEAAQEPASASDSPVGENAALEAPTSAEGAVELNPEAPDPAAGEQPADTEQAPVLEQPEQQQPFGEPELAAEQPRGASAHAALPDLSADATEGDSHAPAPAEQEPPEAAHQESAPPDGASEDSYVPAVDDPAVDGRAAPADGTEAEPEESLPEDTEAEPEAPSDEVEAPGDEPDEPAEAPTDDAEEPTDEGDEPEQEPETPDEQPDEPEQAPEDPSEQAPDSPPGPPPAP